MTSSDLPIRPPKFAAWCVELFTSPDEADGVLGDLAEEFHESVAIMGAREARREYRRDALRTIRDLAMAPWQRAGATGLSATGTLTSLGLGVVALAMSFPIDWMVKAAAQALVVHYSVYDVVPAAFFWNAVLALGPFTAGLAFALLARLAGMRPMSIGVAMTVAVAILLAVDTPIMVWMYGPPHDRPLTFSVIALRWLRGVALFGGLQLLGFAIGRKLPWPAATARPVTSP